MLQALLFSLSLLPQMMQVMQQNAMSLCTCYLLPTSLLPLRCFVPDPLPLLQMQAWATSIFSMFHVPCSMFLATQQRGVEPGR